MSSVLIQTTFEAHQPIIGRYARSSPKAMGNVFQFVIATVQQALVTVPTILESFQQDGRGSVYAFGFKRDALDWLEENQESLYKQSLNIYDGYANPEDASAELLFYFAGLPGLGLVKGGFMAQLAFGVGGCLDTHNIKRFGLNPARFKACRFKDARTASTKNKIVSEYLDYCRQSGGCALLWAEWCDYVATNQPKVYPGAAAVSALHVESLKKIDPKCNLLTSC